MSSINLNAILHPIVDDHPGTPHTVMQGGPKPCIVIEFPQPDASGLLADDTDIKIESTGLSQEQVGYFLHELSHMIMEPDTAETVMLEQETN